MLKYFKKVNFIFQLRKSKFKNTKMQKYHRGSIFHELELLKFPDNQSAFYISQNNFISLIDNISL